MSTGRKITDLERLTQPGGKVLPDDESIPVLTERLSLPSLELDISLPEGIAVDGIAVDGIAVDGIAVDVEAAQPVDEPDPATAFPEPSPTFEAADSSALPAAFRPWKQAPPVGPELTAEPEPIDDPEPIDEPDVTVEPNVNIDWTQVEEGAREALLRELQARLASELDRQLRERLQPTLVRMLLVTVTELRPSIEAAVRESVAQVVAAEVARQRSRT